MMKFDKKSIVYMGILLMALVMSVANCISNIVVFNMFSLVIDFVFVVMVCFVSGYMFCRFEMSAKVVETKDNDVPKEKVEDIFITPTDKDLTEL